jgi:hypothetical protein
MSEAYQEIAYKPILIAKFGSSVTCFEFFVAFSASIRLGSLTYEIVTFFDIL